MSSICGYDLESFIAWNHDLKIEGLEGCNESLRIAEIMGVSTKRISLTNEQFSGIVALYEPYRENIEYLLGDFDEETQNWRDYSYAVFCNIPQEVIDSANKAIAKLIEVKS